MRDSCSGLSRGMFLILAGFVLLFHSFGILRMKYIIVAISLYLIFLGFVQFGGIEKIKTLIKK